MRQIRSNVTWIIATCMTCWMKPCLPGFGRGALVVDKSAIRARFARLERCIAKLRAATEDLDFDAYLEDEFLQDVLEHNLQILRRLKSFKALGHPVCIGTSRKSFIGKLLGVDLGARLPGALACACLAVSAGAQIIRTHDVAPTVQAVRLTEAIRARQTNDVA